MGKHERPTMTSYELFGVDSPFSPNSLVNYSLWKRFNLKYYFEIFLLVLLNKYNKYS